MSSVLSEVNTKLKAYKLIHEPIRLLFLLYTKYGDIEEDLNILLIDQLVFNQSTHFNNIFKEYFFFNNNSEFLRRFYNDNESCSRIPKLGDHYKNYYAYYCRPFFIDIYHYNLLKKYYNTKAGIFYKNKYSRCESSNKKVTNSIIDSFDNDTENKTIFNKKNKFLIDNNIESKKSSITLTLENISENNNNNNGLISKRSENDSFVQFLKNYLSGESNLENNEINNISTKNNDKSNIDSEEKTQIINKYNIENCYLNNINICLNNYKNNKIKLYGNKISNNLKIKDNSYINKLSDIKKNFYNISKKIKSQDKASRLSRNMSNLENYKVSSLNSSKNRKKFIYKIDNEDYYFSNDNIKNIKSKKNKNYKNKRIKNFFFNLNSKKASIDNIKSRNNKKLNELDCFNSKNFISLKNSRNNINNIKFLKLNKKPNIYNNIKLLPKKKNLEIKLDYKKLIKNSKKKGCNNCNKQNILNKISSQNNSKSNNNQNINKPQKLLSPNSNSNSTRNKIIFRRNSKIINKLILLDSASYEKKTFNITPIRKANSKLFKSNSSYSRRKSGNNKFMGGIKYNINNSKQQKKLNLKFLQNMLNKNNFKNFMNKINGIKNKSRNKTNYMNIFYSKSSLAQSLMGSQSQSKSKSRSKSKSINKEDKNNKILIKTNSMTKSIDFNNNYKKKINPIKMTINKIIKEKMNEIMKNSSMLEKRLGLSEEKYSHIKNNNIFKTFIKNSKKNISKPINLRKKLNNNNIFLKNIKNK